MLNKSVKAYHLIKLSLFLTLLLTVGFSRPVHAAQPPMPNVVIIFIDDQGYQDLGCFDSPLIKTPNIDKMAAEGMRFTDFYSAAPVCSPSRAALLTGCYPLRIGITGVLFPRHNIGLNPKETTIADLLKTRGYATCCVGKWHIGHKTPFLPTRQGFDSYLGIPYSNDMSVDLKAPLDDNITWREGMTLEKFKTHTPQKKWVPLMRDEKIIEYPCDQDTLTQRYTRRAVQFIRDQHDKRFFLYLAHTMPHVPLHVSPQFRGTSARGLYGDAIEEIDWSVSQILAALKEFHIEKNTWVIYTSDNGPWLSMKENGGCALPLRGGKFETWDGGMREPCVMYWPGHIPAGSVNHQLASTIDLLPTIARLTGAPLPEKPIDGLDISAMLTDPQTPTPHQAFYFYRGKSLEAIRTDKWKLRIAKGKTELFNLEDDISESVNLARQRPDLVKQLKQNMNSFGTALKAAARPQGVLPQ